MDFVNVNKIVKPNCLQLFFYLTLKYDYTLLGIKWLLKLVLYLLGYVLTDKAMCRWILLKLSENYGKLPMGYSGY